MGCGGTVEEASSKLNRRLVRELVAVLDELFDLVDGLVDLVLVEKVLDLVAKLEHLLADDVVVRACKWLKEMREHFCFSFLLLFNYDNLLLLLLNQ